MSLFALLSAYLLKRENQRQKQQVMSSLITDFSLINTDKAQEWLFLVQYLVTCYKKPKLRQNLDRGEKAQTLLRNEILIETFDFLEKQWFQGSTESGGESGSKNKKVTCSA